MTVAAEFSRCLPVDRIAAGGITQHIEATADECAALAARLAVPAVLDFACTFRLGRGTAGRVTAAGRLRARLLRDCVVSLEPFACDVSEDFAVAFVPEGTLDAALDLAADDEIPYAGAAIDLGEAAVEQLALILDPYPRRPGVALAEDADAAPESPFAALAARRADR